MLIKAVKLISRAAVEARPSDVREGWWRYRKDQWILSKFIIETRREIELVQRRLGSCPEAGSGQDGIKRCKPMTCNEVQRRDSQLKKYRAQMEGT